MDIFEKFSNGSLVLPDAKKSFADVEWKKHPAFKGVEIKKIVSEEETDGKFSFCLVRIAPDCSIGEHIHVSQLETHEVIKGYGECINDGKKIEYKEGIISIMPAGIKHEVNAGKEGLCLLAKFITTKA